MPDLPPYAYGYLITFFLSAAICYADLREAAFIGFEGRRSRYPIHRSLSCWAVVILVGIFGYGVYLLVVKYPEIVAETTVGDLSTGSWILASFGSGLGAVALIRSKLFPVGDTQVGLEPIYEMAKAGAIDNLVQHTAQDKQKIVDEYAVQFNGNPNFVDELKDYVLNILATRTEEDRQEFQAQIASITNLLEPGANPTDADWEQYHRRCIRLAIDFIGNSAAKKWLKIRLNH